MSDRPAKRVPVARTTRFVALIDLGTNSIRNDIYEVVDSSHVRTLFTSREMIRLGEGLYLDNRITAAAEQRLLRSLERFSLQCEAFAVQEVVAIATSAMREARNGRAVQKRIQDATGVRFRIISGAEEARLIALGVLTREKVPPGAFAIVDIGGGSTEVIACRRRAVLARRSIPMGVARIQQTCLRRSPPPSLADASIFFAKMRIGASARAMAAYPCRAILGCSGTIKAIAKVLKRTEGSNVIHRHELLKLRHSLAHKNRRQIARIPGMTVRRVDLILAGTLILEACMDLVGASVVIPTRYSLRDGLLAEVMARLHPSRTGYPSQRPGARKRLSSGRKGFPPARHKKPESNPRGSRRRQYAPAAAPLPRS